MNILGKLKLAAAFAPARDGAGHERSELESPGGNRAIGRRSAGVGKT